jgi:chemotaxis protein methyltransferase CheR
MEFETFREFFYRHTGILYEESKRYYVDKRLIERFHATDTRSLREYLNIVRLQPSETEMQALINALTINETYFYRDEVQFESLVQSALPEIMANRRREKVLRVWSSPCSSGEEPYSLAIQLLERWPAVDDYDIEIYGTDIDTHMLAAARRGIYSVRSIQYLPVSVLRKYFTRLSEGRHQICDELRSSVTFERINIMDVRQTRTYRDFDVIFSRNMLIYFDDKSRRIAADAFYDALRPGGFIWLAPSESMSRITPLFKVRSFPGANAFQKPL